MMSNFKSKQKISIDHLVTHILKCSVKFNEIDINISDKLITDTTNAQIMSVIKLKYNFLDKYLQRCIIENVSNQKINGNKTINISFYSSLFKLIMPTNTNIIDNETQIINVSCLIEKIIKDIRSKKLIKFLDLNNTLFQPKQLENSFKEYETTPAVLQFISYYMDVNILILDNLLDKPQLVYCDENLNIYKYLIIFYKNNNIYTPLFMLDELNNKECKFQITHILYKFIFDNLSMFDLLNKMNKETICKLNSNQNLDLARYINHFTLKIDDDNSSVCDSIQSNSDNIKLNIIKLDVIPDFLKNNHIIKTPIITSPIIKLDIIKLDNIKLTDLADQTEYNESGNEFASCNESDLENEPNNHLIIDETEINNNNLNILVNLGIKPIILKDKLKLEELQQYAKTLNVDIYSKVKVIKTGVFKFKTKADLLIDIKLKLKN